MSFKNPFKSNVIAKVGAKLYIKKLATLISKKFLNGNSVPFIILLNHKYSDLDEKKSARLPFLLLGNRDSSWKDYHKKDGGDQKKNMVSGIVRRNGDELFFDIDASKGLNKIPRKSLQYLEAVLKKINKNYSVNTTGGSGGTIDEETNKARAKEVAKETKNMDGEVMRDLKTSQEVTDYKKEKQQEAQELNEKFKDLRKMMGSSLKKVAKNVKKGATSKKDMERVKEANKAFSEVVKIYGKTSEQVRMKFTPAFNKLNSQKQELVKLSLAAKQKKKSVADRLAEKYAKAKKKEVDKKLTKEINGIIKDAIAMNKKRRKKAKQDLLLKATLFVLKKTGIKNFKVKYVNQILQKKAA